MGALHDSSMSSGKKCSQMDSLKKKFDDLSDSMHEARTGMRENPEETVKHLEFKRKYNRLRHERSRIKHALTQVGANLKEVESVRNLSIYLNALSEIDKVLVSVFERHGPEDDRKQRRKVRAKKVKHLNSLRSIKSMLPVEVLEEKMAEWKGELEKIEDRVAHMKSPCKKGLTEEEKITHVRRETLQGLIEAMQAKEDTGASKGGSSSSGEEQIECAKALLALGSARGDGGAPGDE